MPRAKKRKRGKGSVFYLEDKRLWCGKYRNGYNKNKKPKYSVVYAKTKTEAEKKLAKAMEKAVSMPRSLVGDYTIKEFLEKWHQDTLDELTAKSGDRREQTIKYDVVPYIGAIKVDDLTTDHVDGMIKALKDAGKSRSSIKKAREAVTGSYRWAMQREPPLLSRNPALASTLPKKKKFNNAKEAKVYSKEEAFALIEAGYAKWGNGQRIYRLGATVELLLNTGVRLGELVALRWDCVDFKGRTMEIRRTTAHAKDRSKNAANNYVYIEQEFTKTEEVYSV